MFRDCNFVISDSAYYDTMWNDFCTRCKMVGFTPKVTQKVSQLTSCLAIVRQSNACVLVGGHHHSLATNGLGYVRIDEPGMGKTLSFARLASNNNLYISRFIDLFINNANFEYSGK